MGKRTILAVDFDLTVAETDFPTIWGAVEDAKKYVNKLYEEGYYIIIWTCRDGAQLLEAEDWLLDEGFKFHKVNQQEPSGRIKYKNDTRKVYADCYIDDRQVGGLPAWKDIYTWITTSKHLKLDRYEI